MYRNYEAEVYIEDNRFVVLWWSLQQLTIGVSGRIGSQTVFEFCNRNPSDKRLNQAQIVTQCQCVLQLYIGLWGTKVTDEQRLVIYLPLIARKAMELLKLMSQSANSQIASTYLEEIEIEATAEHQLPTFAH